ncbi:MAG: dihydroxy-acid dehydratase, partial [Lentisphaerota bacterium]
EAYMGGPLAIVRNGDEITIDAQKCTLTLSLSPQIIRRRLAKWRAPKPRYTRGVLYKYFRQVSPASKGAVTDGEGGASTRFQVSGFKFRYLRA